MSSTTPHLCQHTSPAVGVESVWSPKRASQTDDAPLILGYNQAFEQVRLNSLRDCGRMISVQAAARLGNPSLLKGRAVQLRPCRLMYLTHRAVLSEVKKAKGNSSPATHSADPLLLSAGLDQSRLGPPPVLAPSCTLLPPPPLGAPPSQKMSLLLQVFQAYEQRLPARAVVEMTNRNAVQPGEGVGCRGWRSAAGCNIGSVYLCVWRARLLCMWRLCGTCEQSLTVPSSAVCLVSQQAVQPAIYV